MKAKERRRQKLRRKRTKNSPYSHFTKPEIELINEVKNTQIWQQQNSRLPEDLRVDKTFQKEQFQHMIKTYKEMTGTETQEEKKAGDCGCGAKATVNEDLINDYVDDVLGIDTEKNCSCKRAKPYCIGAGILVLILLLLIYAVFFKK